MVRHVPLEAIDSRTVFVVYAAVIGAAGVSTALLGGPWASLAGGPPSYDVSAITRTAGTLMGAAACCAFAFSRIGDPVDRRRGLSWFVVAHTLVLLVASIQVFAVGRGGLLPDVAWLYWGLAATCVCLLSAWMRHGGDIPPLGVSLGLFGERPPNPTDVLRAQYQEQMREAGAQQERHRLARELHDSIKQQIFAIQTAAATAETRLPSDPEGTRQAIARVRDSARESMVEMDAMLDQLRVTAVENTGLIEALKKQCEALEIRTGATVAFTAGPLPPSDALPPGAHRALLRIAREALSNVARHARATRVAVTLSATGTHVRLRVTDDGAGYDADSAPRGMGLGNTVKTHVAHLLAKLGVDNRAQAIVEALRRRLVSIEDLEAAPE